MEHDTYSFEVPFAESAHAERSVVLDASETGNWAPEYQQLHVGDVAVGGQIVVFYEQGSEAGIATLQKSDATDGMHGWQLSTVSHTDAAEPQQRAFGTVSIATAAPEGFMNRHCFIEPGNELLIDGRHTVNIGTIAAIHTIEAPQHSSASQQLQPKTFRARFIQFVQAHRPFAKAA